MIGFSKKIFIEEVGSICSLRNLLAVFLGSLIVYIYVDSIPIWLHLTLPKSLIMYFLLSSPFISYLNHRDIKSFQGYAIAGILSSLPAAAAILFSATWPHSSVRGSLSTEDALLEYMGNGSIVLTILIPMCLVCATIHWSVYVSGDIKKRIILTIITGLISYFAVTAMFETVGSDGY